MARDVGIGRRALREPRREARTSGACSEASTSVQSTPDSLALARPSCLLVVSPAAVLCDRTAAWLHGIDVFWSAEHDYPSRLETFVLRGSTRLTRAET